MFSRSLPFAGLVSILLAGCDQAAVQPTAGDTAPRGERAEVPASADAAPEAEPEAAKEVTLEVADLDRIRQVIGEHKGRVVVVDFWADYCIPCKKEFPNLVKLQKKHPEAVTAISVSLDDPEDKDTALEFLKAQGATFPNLLAKDPTPVQNAWKFEAIPTALVYDRSGELAKKFSWDDIDDQFTYEDVENLVDDLVKQGKTGG